MFEIVKSLSRGPSNQETPVHLAFAKREPNHLLNKMSELFLLLPIAKCDIVRETK